MTFFDMRTIIFTYVIADVVCLIVIVLLWLQNRKRFAGTLYWVFDFVFQLSGLFLIVLRGRIPDWMSYIVASTFIMTGALLGYMGLERFVGRIRSQLHNYVLLASFILVHTYFTFVQPDQAVRNLNASVMLLVICFQCARLLLHSVKPDMRRLTRGVGIVFGIYCVVNAVRIVEYFIGTQATIDYLQSGTFDKIALIANQMLFFLLTYSLVLMFSKRLLSEVVAQEEKYSKAFHSSPYGIILTRLSDGQIIEVNQGLLDITEYQYKDVRGKTTRDLGLWDRNKDRDTVIHELKDKGRIREREFQFRKKSGQKLTGLLSAEIVTIDNEKHILSSINNITESKNTEDNLRKNEAFTRAVIDNLPVGIAVNSIDPSVTFSYMNDNFPGYYRTTREALAGPDSFWDAVYEDPHFREEIKKRVLDDCASGDPARMFWINVPLSRQGEKTTFITARNIPVPHERLMISIVQDVTEHKDAEEEIRKLNISLKEKVAERTRALGDNQLALLNVVDDLAESSRRLQTANQALNAVNKELAAFSYSVSHDLRAPLRSVDGFSQALLEDCGDNLDDNGKRYLKKIRNATQNMGRLIDDMLNLSRVTQSEFHQERVNLSEMVREIAEEHRQHKPLNGLTINIQEDIIVKGDRRLIHIAMTNLLDNAWKFSGKRERPCIGFGVVVSEGGKIIFVNDNGVGFDMNYAGKLFGAFQRLHRFDEFPGTGIGLATVLRVINRHGGQIWAESEVDKGATFFFTLPE